MDNNNSEAKEKIIESTTRLIIKYEDTSKITVRDIAIKSGVGIGLINYHFQTKENLIAICILRIVSEFIKEIERLYLSLDLSPLDKLKHVFKKKSEFIVSNPGISKISMLLDLNSSRSDDNTDQAAKVHIKILKELFGNKKTENELYTILHIISSSIQVAFLRRNNFKMHTDIDFYDKDQREKFIDELIDSVINFAQ